MKKKRISFIIIFEMWIFSEWIDKFPMPDLSQFDEFVKMVDKMIDAAVQMNPRFTRGYIRSKKSLL